MKDYEAKKILTSKRYSKDGKTVELQLCHARVSEDNKTLRTVPIGDSSVGNINNIMLNGAVELVQDMCTVVYDGLFYWVVERCLGTKGWNKVS